MFVSYFALPALIFQSLVSLSFGNIDFNLVGCILISKCLIFAAVFGITFMLSYHSSSKCLAVQRSSIYAIFCTQSNDFALGYPMFISLYGNGKDSLANYLYVLAPIQLLLLNPIGLFLIEITKNIEDNVVETSRLRRFFLILKIVLQKILINPIIFATFFGMFLNLVGGGHLPAVVVPILTSLSQSFTSIALFLLGVNLFGNFKLFKDLSHHLLVTLVLVAVKIFLMPLLNRALVIHVDLFDESMHNVTTSSDFAFTYGTIPAAPTVYILSTFYNLETIIISTGLVISTLFSAPLMFISANMIRLSANIDYRMLTQDLFETIFFTSLTSLVASLFLIFNLFYAFRLRSITHRCTFKILVSHILILIAGILYKFGNADDNIFTTNISVVQYFLFSIGFFSLKLWTCCLSILMVLLYYKSLCYALLISDRFLYSSLVSIIIYILFITFTFDRFPRLETDTLVNIYYGYNKVHLMISIIMSLITVLVSLIALVCLRYYKTTAQNYEPMDDGPQELEEPRPVVVDIPRANTSANGNVVAKNRNNIPKRVRCISSSSGIEIEDMYLALQPQQDSDDFKDVCNDRCHSVCSGAKTCGSRLQKYKQDIENAIDAIELNPSPFEHEPLSHNFHQIYQHHYLQMFLLLSIMVHLALEICQFFEEKMTGIFVEIEFLDILLVFSLGVVMLIFFGFDADALLLKLYRLVKLKHQSGIYLPPIERLNSDTLELCTFFRERHQHNFADEVAFSLSEGEAFERKYFRGHQLVDWLVKRRITESRDDAINLGTHLLFGRVIEHISREHYFCDNTYYYKFITS